MALIEANESVAEDSFMIETIILPGREFKSTRN